MPSSDPGCHESIRTCLHRTQAPGPNEVSSTNGQRNTRGGPDVKLQLVLANLSKNSQQLSKGMTIAYAKLNPLALLTVPDEVSMKPEAVLNLPLTTKTANDTTNNYSTDSNGPDEHRKPTDWRDTIDLGYIDNEEMRTKILTMLTKHGDMWTNGRRTEITAAEYRFTLETGTKPIRSMPCRRGPAMRTRAEAEIRKMRDVGVIEPATSQ